MTSLSRKRMTAYSCILARVLKISVRQNFGLLDLCVRVVLLVCKEKNYHELNYLAQLSNSFEQSSKLDLSISKSPRWSILLGRSKSKYSYKHRMNDKKQSVIYKGFNSNCESVKSLKRHIVTIHRGRE